MIRVGCVNQVLPTLAAASVQCCLTSPPYWGLRDYGIEGQLGLEKTPEEYVEKMVAVFREIRRVLRDDGTLFLNMGDGYATNPAGRMATSGTLEGGGFRSNKGMSTIVPGLKPKDLIGMPWRVAFALQADGWYLRSDIIWSKPNPMPESATDRPTKAHEYVFLLTKGPRYFYDAEAVREGVRPASQIRMQAGFAGSERDKQNNYGEHFQRGEGYTLTSRNLRTVWTIPTQGFSEAHFATFPEALVAKCLLAGTSHKGCCPECGAPWVRVVDKSRVPTRPGNNAKIKVPGGWMVGPGSHGTIHSEGRTTVGWQPGCECGGEPVPCTVLDPFAGSGTVGVVCKRMGLNFIGVELNPEYVTIAEQRIANPDPEPVTADVPGQGQLWE